MLIRYRKRPLPLQKMDALIARLSENHPQLAYLKKEVAKQQKGYNGERKLDYHVETLADDFSIMADVCFQLHGKMTQIDSLIISANAIYITEVKSYEGTVTFDTKMRQCYRDINGNIKRYKYPITQTQMIQSQLLRFLQLANLNGMPIYYFVAFSERSTYIHVEGEGASLKNIVTYVEDVPFLIRSIDEKLTAQNRTPQNNLQTKIIQHIMNHCEDFDIDVYENYDIKKSDIMSGVQCEKCEQLTMIRTVTKWQCQKCATTSDTAHIKSLYEYALLRSQYISNSECRKFLQLSSRHTTKYLLKTAPNTQKHQERKWKINKTFKKEYNNKL